MPELRCRKCRCVMLNRGESILPAHEIDPTATKPKDFLLKDIRGNVPGVNRPLNTLARCTHIFTEELPWMESFIRDVPEGVIACPKCSGKVGQFSWIGVQCSCGKWEVPGFAFLKSKVDLLP